MTSRPGGFSHRKDKSLGVFRTKKENPNRKLVPSPFSIIVFQDVSLLAFVSSFAPGVLSSESGKELCRLSWGFSGQK